MAHICFKKSRSCKDCEYYGYNKLEERNECYKNILIPLRDYKICVGQTAFRSELADAAETLEEAIKMCEKYYSHIAFNGIYHNGKLVWHVSN